MITWEKKSHVVGLTRVIAIYECVEISSFAMLHLKLWLKKYKFVDQFCAFD